MITKGELSWCVNKFSQLVTQQTYRKQQWRRICRMILRLNLRVKWMQAVSLLRTQEPKVKICQEVKFATEPLANWTPVYLALYNVSLEVFCSVVFCLYTVLSRTSFGTCFLLVAASLQVKNTVVCTSTCTAYILVFCFCSFEIHSKTNL